MCLKMSMYRNVMLMREREESRNKAYCWREEDRLSREMRKNEKESRGYVADMRDRILKCGWKGKGYTESGRRD